MISSLTYNHLVLAASPPLLPCQGMALTLNIISVIMYYLHLNQQHVIVIVATIV